MARVRGATATRELRKQAGSGKFLTVSDGDAYEVAFAGVLKHGLEGDLAEPMGIEVVWKERRDGTRYSEEYDPKKHSEGDITVRFMWNVLVRGKAEDGSEDEMKIFEQGPQFFDQFIKHKDKKGYAYWFTISREGKGQFDTKYSLDREDAIPEGEVEDIKNMKLNDLDTANEENNNGNEDAPRDDNKSNGRSSGSNRRRAADAPRTSASGNGGLSDDQKSKIKEAMLQLPDPAKAKGAFMTRFGIEKLGELPPDKVDDAIGFINSIREGEGDTSGGVDDPFFG